MKNGITDFTNGNIAKSLLYFSVPFLITNIIQSLYNIVDIMVVSHYCGPNGIAGASIGGSVTQTVTYMIIGLCNGGAIMTAHYVGMKSEKDVKETIGTTFGIMFMLSVVSSVLMLIFARNILSALNTPNEAFSDTLSYFRICMSGSVFIFGYNAISSVLRGVGNSKTPMYFGFASCLINVALDLLFVGALKTGVSGAAAATVISQAISLVSCAVYLKKQKFLFDFRLSSFRIVPDKAVNIFKLGLPGAIQNAIVSGGFLLVSSITNSLGVNAASAVSVAAKVNGFAQMPASAIGMAVSSIIGQNVGARKFDRARKTLSYGIMISLGFGVVMFTAVQLMPAQLMGLLIDEHDVIQTALPYLRITAFDYLLVALIFPLNGLCNGSGHTMFTMIPSIFSSVIARVPVAYFCVYALDMGLSGVAVSTPTGTISAIIICAVYYFSNKWCRITI